MLFCYSAHVGKTKRCRPSRKNTNNGQVFHSLSIFFDICQNIFLVNIIYSKKMTATIILNLNEDSQRMS
ncbi:hypothetical protein F0241_13505 [Vibrio kanaloae]|uniref:Uncharacterized protein n=1 Tax=Vibrio kanaloae TaxID=170673 RepID=A0A4U1ZDU8_9VIBR|nr:hypothetical protein [Vibrio kanaloae]TKE97025.1 hypothetical protein FCV44_10460 [Vibrio kanaloae]TKF13955.1 hypothetical protein FCV47_17280 [Vibrio kanaloae]TKF29077.1 hypothetical protein FCV52_00260 [Vibrio kanaloae]TKF32570.1 hypothetical protein FCV50_08960 [Vibrio kanaloae]